MALVLGAALVMAGCAASNDTRVLAEQSSVGTASYGASTREPANRTASRVFADIAIERVTGQVAARF